MRKILIPTDFSACSFNAIRYAMELFKYDRGDIYLLHAYADEVYEDKAVLDRNGLEEVKENVHQKTVQELDKLLLKMNELAPNPRHHFHSKAVFGVMIDAVNDFIEEENIDIVVMGTEGASREKEITFGSQTLQIIKYVKCPVLAVPACYKDSNPQHFLFPTDYLVPFAKRELKLVSTMVKNLAARITLLYVSKFEKLSFRQEDNQAFLLDCLKENNSSINHYKGEDVILAINHYIEKEHIDFLVMVNTRHSYLENLLLTSKIDMLGLKVSIPFLVLQNLPR
jgi:nucleotide-binding universal stress UspA family protein